MNEKPDMDHPPLPSDGYLRQWLVSGPVETVYDGPPASESELREGLLARRKVSPPQATLGGIGPEGAPWRYYVGGGNIFCEVSAFYHRLCTVTTWAATGLVARETCTREVEVWAAGGLDVWLNGRLIVRHDVSRYMYPAPTLRTFTLSAGLNRIIARMQVCGMRDTRQLLGLRFLDPAGLRLHLPATREQNRVLIAGGSWLDSVRVVDCRRLAANGPAPPGVEVSCGDDTQAWPTGANEWTAPQAADVQRGVALDVAGQRLQRSFEFPQNRRWPRRDDASFEQNRRCVLEKLARCMEPLADAGPIHGLCSMIARRALNRPRERDGERMAGAMDFVRERKDCADFTLAMLLRLRGFGWLKADEESALRDLLLGFRYWHDEEGSDAMCFDSENHSLLFHGAQMLAGEWLPDARFSASGRRGHEQARLGGERCRAWLASVERRGYVEFNASGYLAITVAALLNLVDFAGDPKMRGRAAAQVDAILGLLARHTFKGVVVAPQGRVYRDVLTPETTPAQAMVSYAVPGVIQADTDWLAFLATSANYRPPVELAPLVDEPLTLDYRQGDVDLALEKTDGYLLTSVRIPAAFPLSEEARPLLPGAPGYQQHLWQATLAPGCHVFVNHPGETFDLGHARPGYWYGNGHLPALTYRPKTVLAIYAIPLDHPVGFTHAHWPMDAFDATRHHPHWLFGAKDDGYVGLWCSQPLRSHDDVLAGREWRAYGRVAAWVCRVAERRHFASLDHFANNCLSHAPGFDAASLTLVPGDASGNPVRFMNGDKK